MTISQADQIDDQRALIMSLQALVDPELLALIGALAEGERDLAELAGRTRQPASLARGPVGRLHFLELISSRQEGGRIICALNRRRLYALNGMLQRLSKELLGARQPTPADERPASGLSAEQRAILQRCFRDGRLVAIPSSPRRLEAVLIWLVDQFEPGRRYPEREVNELIGRYHPDFATLRRALIDHGLMERAADVYWRT